jgi:anthranilate phosphoribosyltransferase
MNSPPAISDILKRLLTRSELPAEWMRSMMERMMTSECPPEEAAAFLVALRMKEETAEEIATAAQVLREHMVRWDAGRDVLDTCGTGGDGSGTFNISTATALVVAAAGVPVVKHGNRSVSSKSGSADVLAALGIAIEGGPEQARRSLDQADLAFCFAPLFHPALKHVAPVRRKLGIPTLFNCLGPLANPAGARHQVLGVGRLDLLDRMAQALHRLGAEHSFLVCSQDGLDEVSLSASTHVREVTGAGIACHIWHARDFDLPEAPLDLVKVADAQESAALILRVLEGEEGPALHIVLANAAVGLVAMARASTLREGVSLARQAIRAGKAVEVLTRLRSVTIH